MNTTTYYINTGNIPREVKGTQFNLDGLSFGIDKRFSDEVFNDGDCVVTELSTGMTLGKAYIGENYAECISKVQENISAIKDQVAKVKADPRGIKYIQKFREEVDRLSKKGTRKKLI